MFDVEANTFWYPQWGQRPTELRAALAIAREQLVQVPALVPVYSHRYISTEPPQAGNPVFSIVQTDIITYGKDLATYLAAEFGITLDGPRPEPRRIRFWSDLVDMNNGVLPS